jgi:hypothetical protein
MNAEARRRFWTHRHGQSQHGDCGGKGRRVVGPDAEEQTAHEPSETDGEQKAGNDSHDQHDDTGDQEEAHTTSRRPAPSATRTATS